jgi:hypothetical protein
MSRPLIAILCVAALSISCATLPEETKLAEPYKYFNTQPQIYARFSSQAFRRIIASFDDPKLGYDLAALRSMDDFLGRARILGAGISGLGTDNPRAEAVALGDFQVFSLRLAMAASGEWARKPDGGYRSTLYPVELLPPQPGVVHLVSSAPASDKAGPAFLQAFPPAFGSLADSEIFISINSPSALLARQLPFDSFALPVNAILLSGNSVQIGGENKYSLEVRFAMKDESVARSYRPVVKFLWTSAAQILFGDSVDAAATDLVLAGDTYIARGIQLGDADMAILLARALAYR